MIELGDMVRLKSGGPFMTVNCVTNKTCTCVWFSDDVLRDGLFAKDALVRLIRAPEVDEGQSPHD